MITKNDIKKLVAEKLKDIGNKLDTTGDGKDVTVTATAAATRANITTGDKLSVVIGKLMKWFTDLKSVAWSGSYNDLTDKPDLSSIETDIGDMELLTDATNLTDAINEHETDIGDMELDTQATNLTDAINELVADLQNLHGIVGQ